MKKLYTLIAGIMLTASVFGQAPEKMSYQAVVRDGSNNLVSSSPVGMQISILQGAVNGSSVYTETQTPTSNTNGLVSLEIGSGTVVSGTFSAIVWENGPYFIKTETDPTGGTNYTITGTSQLLSVPFAMYAKTSGSSIPGPQGPQGPQGPAGNDGATGPQGPAYTGNCGLAIGDSHLGGIIFYLDSTGCHGLIAAPTDQSATPMAWFNSYSLVNAAASGVGAGLGNTAIICNAFGNTILYPARLCRELNLGGNFLEWYLPSVHELKLMHSNIGQGNALGLGNIGGFVNNGYWSSTEANSGEAWYFNFTGTVGGISYTNKFSNAYVRAVRQF